MRDYLRLLFVAAVFAVYGFTVSQLHGAQPGVATMKADIQANMERNMEACNEEDLDKLLGLMSKEMPNRNRFINTIQSFWTTNDTYNRLEHLEVLKRSNAPNGITKYPYATVKVRQTTRYIRSRPEDNAVWKQVCADGKCSADEMPHLMAIAPRAETVEYEVLFKYEDGEWKGVANVSEPVEPGQPPRYPRMRRSVF
jgi:hypothetical protein